MQTLIFLTALLSLPFQAKDHSSAYTEAYPRHAEVAALEVEEHDEDPHNEDPHDEPEEPAWEEVVMEDPAAEEIVLEALPAEPAAAETPEAVAVEPRRTEEPEAPAPSASGTYLGTFEATSYAVGAWGVPSTVTANGTDIANTIYSPEGHHIIAVDTNIIPMNTIVRVEVPGMEPFLAKASDTGGMIKGYIIDILMETPEQSLSFGRRYGIAVYLVH